MKARASRGVNGTGMRLFIAWGACLNIGGNAQVFFSASEPALVIERELQEVVAAVDVKLGAADNSGPFSR